MPSKALSLRSLLIIQPMFESLVLVDDVLVPKVRIREIRESGAMEGGPKVVRGVPHIIN